MDIIEDSPTTIPVYGSPRRDAHRRRNLSGQVGSWAGVLSAWTNRVRWSSLFAGVALLTGIVYCVVTFSYWRATRDAIDQLHQQAILAQRPWITMPRIRLVEPLTVGHPVSAAVSLRNTGQSPALDVVTSGMLVFRRSAPGFVQIPGGDQRRMDLGASDEQVIRVEFDGGGMLRDDDFAELRSGRQILYAIAEINYSDVFGNTGSTKVCAEYRPALSDFGPCQVGSELR